MSNHAARFADLSCLKSNDPAKVKRCIFNAERGAIDASRARYQTEKPAMTASDNNHENHAAPPHPDWIMAMSLEDLRAENDKYRAQHVRPQWSTQDQIEGATGAFVASAINRKPGADLHPLTNAHLDHGPTGLMSLARNVGAAIGQPLKNESGNEVLALALTSSHVPNAIMEAASAVVRSRVSPLLTAVRAATTDLVVPDYRAQPYGMVDIELGMPTEDSTGRFLMILPEIADQPIKLNSTFGKLAISIQALTNDDFNLVPSLVTAFITAAARAEAAELARLLGANALPNGETWFTGDNIGTADLTMDGLGTAAGMLRAQKTETGERSGEPIKTIIVNGDDEITALALVEQLPQDRRPRVAVLPKLANSSWYAVADPQSCPAIGRVRMQGSDPSALSFSSISEPKWRADNGELRDIPGVAIDATHTVGLSPLSRVGIVKLAKS